MYTVTIKFPQGPTISDEDSVLVTVVRMCFDNDQATKLQEAALILGADSVHIKKPAKQGGTS